MFEASEKAFKHAKNINDYCEITYILNKRVIIVQTRNKHGKNVKTESAYKEVDIFSIAPY